MLLGAERQETVQQETSRSRGRLRQTNRRNTRIHARCSVFEEFTGSTQRKRCSQDGTNHEQDKTGVCVEFSSCHWLRQQLCGPLLGKLRSETRPAAEEEPLTKLQKCTSDITLPPNCMWRPTWSSFFPPNETKTEFFSLQKQTKPLLCRPPGAAGRPASADIAAAASIMERLWDQSLRVLGMAHLEPGTQAI